MGEEQKNIYLTEPEIFRYKNHKTEKKPKNSRDFVFFLDFCLFLKKNAKKTQKIEFWIS
jgi:hypothetical protein